MGPEYKDFDKSVLRESVDLSNLVLLVTATELETKILHANINPLVGQTKILRVFEGNSTYYFGKFGLYNIAHIQCSMGSMARSSSIMTVTDALNFLSSRIVIMVGIAFGVDSKKQKIGDVLLSESVIPYNLKRVGDPDVVMRGMEAPSSKLLVNRFKTLLINWQYPLSKTRFAKLIPTRLLSGEELIDNLGYRNSIISKYPDSKGGEMEGAGVYAACDSRADWILVKGICDFADGKKGVQKSKKQEIAMLAAIDACKEIFEMPSPFSELSIYPALKDDLQDMQILVDYEKVLFDIYEYSNETFYLERAIDSEFQTALKQSGIWISGPSGCGKSNLIFRNLILNDKKFIPINLASCNNSQMIEFFHEVLFSLIEYLNLPITNKYPKRFSEVVKEIINIISQNFTGKEVILFMEEIPIGNEKSYQEFSNKLFSFILSKNLKPGLVNVKLVLSSINSPKGNIESYQQKIHNQIKFIDLKYWHFEEIEKLIHLIESHTRFLLPEEIKKDLIVKSLGSPRFIKKFFRSVFSINAKSVNQLQFLIGETQRDLNLYGNG